MPISAAIQVEGDRDKLETKIQSPTSSSETQLGRPSRSELFLLLFALEQPRAIEGFAGYLLHGTCVLMQHAQICWQSTNLFPTRCIHGYRRWKVGSGHYDDKDGSLYHCL